MIARLRSRRSTAILLWAGAGLLILASFLPWFRSVEIGSSLVTHSGGGGALTLGIAVAVLVCSLLYFVNIESTAIKLTLLFLAASNTFVIVLVVNGHGFPETNEYFSSSFDVGFYAVCIATIILIVGAARALRQPGAFPDTRPGPVTRPRKPLSIALIAAIVLAIPLALVAGYIALFGIMYTMSCGSGC